MTPPMGEQSCRQQHIQLLFLLVVLFGHCAQSLIMHPRIRKNSMSQNPTKSPITEQQAVPEEQPQQQEEDEEPQTRLYGEEAKEMLRELEAVSRERIRAEAERLAEVRERGSLWDKIVSLFRDEKPDETGRKHDCFFSAFNCPVNPSRNLAGVRRVRITPEERERLLELRQRQIANRRKHSQKGQHKRRNRYKL